MNTSKIVRNISGTVLVFICLILILFFGIIPMSKFSVCPVIRDNDHSLYSKGSLAFIREIDVGTLNMGDTAIYYVGGTPIGAKVINNDKAASKIYVVSANNDVVGIPYMKISGKGSSFSVPFLGSYADWLINGAGLNVSIAMMCVMLVIFTTAAVITHEI